MQATTFHQLTTVEKEIALACLGAKIKDYQHDNLLTALIGIIGRAHLSCGFPLDKDRLDLTIDELVTDLQKYNGNLTIMEIEIAFKNGWKKEYGEFYGLSNATYFQWVNAYTWNQSRLNAKKAIEDARNKPVVKPQISEQEKQEIIKQGALKVFEDYKAGAAILDPGNVTYEYLETKGVLDITPERAKKLIAEAKERMIQEAIANKGIKPVAKVIEGVISNKGVIVANAKRQALKEYFDQLIEMEMELKDLV